MRTLTIRRAAITGIAALTIAASSATGAMGEPTTNPLADTPFADAPLINALPSELVEALERDLNMSAEQFIEESDLAQQLAEIANTFRADFPDEFGGAWLNNGVPTIAVTTESLGQQVRDIGFEVKKVSRTEAVLRSDLAQLRDWISTLPEPLHSIFRDIMVNLSDNTIIVGLADTAVGDAIDLPSVLENAGIVFTPANEVIPGEDRIIEEPLPGGTEEQPVFPPASATVPPNFQVMGGDPFLSGSNASLRCSLGFNGVDSDGNAVNITAGHCNPDGPGATGAPTRFLDGPLAGQVFGTFTETNMDDVDYAIITVDDSHKDWFKTAGVRGGSDLHITGTADPVVGMPVCKSGVTTGFSCGVVTSTNLKLEVGNRTLGNAFTSNICALQGDSGGAIISGTRAVGVSSASDVGDFTSCSEAVRQTAIFGDTPLLYATPINDILNTSTYVRLNTQ
ncbi:protease [Hoyosella rhizosphaerae]|uniref:Serine protease n=1 Tax=Hoyosella rhizosphaerae TaxID=1755582 RepID=A0A916XCS4_9ACTN|nr:S1 family peptidase [Hoyosella rhizosphaerae]MBN4927702.1 protease [Hoyosella rhizosphaerae]GGC62335.1 serine protease [Hoyosella rhizosphaerae]